MRDGVVAISLVGEADYDAAFAFKQELLAVGRDGDDVVVDWSPEGDAGLRVSKG